MTFKTFVNLNLIDRTYVEGVVSIDVNINKKVRLSRDITKKLVENDAIMRYCMRKHINDVVNREIDKYINNVRQNLIKEDKNKDCKRKSLIYV
jgi:hypothetical protein